METKTILLAAAVLVLPAAGENVGMVILPDSTNITVAAGDTLRIEFLHGGTTLYKSGEGRLEVAVIGNTNLNIVVSNGTFATARPTSLDYSDDENVIFHLDANKAASLSTRIGDGGTNFITGVADADGRTDRSLSTLSGRPDAYLVQNAISGLPAIDLGSLHNSAADGYGAALAFDESVDTAYEVLYVFEDDPAAKYREKSIGPCLFGSSSSTYLPRGYVDNGTPAPLHSVSIAGRLQGEQYIDGVKRGTAKIDGVASFMAWPVPDGPHVRRWAVADSDSTFTAIPSVLGLGYSTAKATMSYGGLKIGEVLFLVDNGSVAADTFIAPYHAYLMQKWLNAATVAGKITLYGTAALDVSARPLSAQLNIGSYTATVEGGTNFYPRGYCEAGYPTAPVSGAYAVPAAQSVIPGLAFDGDAEIKAASDAKAARIDGTGTLRKAGAGTLTLGAHDSALTSLDVREGTLRIAPLESSGAFLHLDAAAEGTLTYSNSGGTNFVTKWIDSENGVNGAASTTSKLYTFDATRVTCKPYVSSLTQNGLPLIDFGEYTTELYPSGNGGTLVFSPAISTTGANAPGMRNLFAVWGDHEEVKDLPYHNGAALRGPVLVGAGNGWGYRGSGGAGEAFSIYNSNANATYNATGNFRVDGETVAMTHRPSDGLHVLDQRIYNVKADNAGADANYLGGCRWLPAYVGGSGQAPHCGVWGGLRMGEILIYRQLLPEWFRDRISAALRRKWFNATNAVSYSSVAVADGATLALPDTRMAAASLTLGGEIAAEQVAAGVLTVTADATVSGELSIPTGATLTFACGSDGTVPALSVDRVTAGGAFTVTFAFAADDLNAYVGTHRILSFAAEDFSGATPKVSVPRSAKSKGLVASTETREDGLYCTFGICGFSIRIR